MKQKTTDQYEHRTKRTNKSTHQIKTEKSKGRKAKLNQQRNYEQKLTN